MFTFQCLLLSPFSFSNIKYFCYSGSDITLWSVLLNCIIRTIYGRAKIPKWKGSGWAGPPSWPDMRWGGMVTVRSHTHSTPWDRVCSAETALLPDSPAAPTTHRCAVHGPPARRALGWCDKEFWSLRCISRVCGFVGHDGGAARCWTRTNGDN
jgi:hypothetical protein